MLETIKDYISNLPNNDFESHFNQYMMDVQDRSIHDEVNITLRQFKKDILDIERTVQSEYEGLVNQK